MKNLVSNGTLMTSRDIYRVGFQNNGKIGPLIAECVSYKLNIDIFNNADHLKNTGIFIPEDYTQSVYDIQKFLPPNQKFARQRGYNTKMKNNSLHIEEKEYTVERLRKTNPLPNLPQKTIISKTKNTNYNIVEGENNQSIPKNFSGERTGGPERRQEDIEEENQEKRETRLNSKK
ncbi:hypothetical protein JTB14_005997 [Gonioctena quinquepunctata]|nr:hypothetical protein JTB14_005997 [Gonioctena quinquepunctata]